MCTNFYCDSFTFTGFKLVEGSTPLQPRPMVSLKCSPDLELKNGWEIKTVIPMIHIIISSSRSYNIFLYSFNIFSSPHDSAQPSALSQD